MGTELLLGQIVNSNAAVIARRLTEHGYDTHHQVVVGDNMGRLVAALRQALDRSDAVVICGGIGPTQDDLTREAMCELTGRQMTRDTAHARWIEKRIESQGRKASGSVLRMADLPVGAERIDNPVGVALGVALQHEGRWMFALPGVPAEMTAMLDSGVLPRLRALSPDHSSIRSRVVHIWGMGESQVAESLADLFESTNPSIAFLVRDMAVMVRITGKGPDDESVAAIISPVEDEIRARLGDSVFAVDDETVEDIIVTSLTERGWSLATVERATLGLVGARVAASAPPGTFAGTWIAPRGATTVDGPVADVVLRVGDVGDDEGEVRTVREVDMSVETPETSLSRTFRFGGDDERVRAFATIAGLHLIRLALAQAERHA